MDNIKECDAKLLIKKIKEYRKDFPARLLIQKIKSEGITRFENPYYVSWEITAACNLRCRHCCFAGGEYSSKSDIDTETAINLVQDFIDMDVLKVMLTGGEPFLRKDLFEIIEMLKSHNIITEVTSNGLLITDESAKRLGKLFNPVCDYVQISLDGATAGIHEDTRGKGTFQKTLNSIKKLIKNEVKVYINCVVTSKNLHEMCDLYNLASKLGVNKVTFTRVFTEYNNNLIPNDKELFKETIKLLKREEEKTPVELRLFTIPELASCKAFNTPEIIKQLGLEQVSRDFDFSCHSGDKLHIRSDGEVFLCLHASNMNTGSLGNLKQTGLTELLPNRDSNILFGRRTITDTKCLKCIYAKICKAGCPVNAYLEYKSIDFPDSACKIS